MTKNNRPLDVIILAAGQGTRMKSELPKVLHPVAGRPMVAWAVKAARSLGARKIVVVTGYNAEKVESVLRADDIVFARQDKQLGTGHAFQCGVKALENGNNADILLLYGDTPLLRTETLRDLIADHRNRQNAMTVLTGELPDATGYGRILRDTEGKIERIVEQKDGTPEQLTVKEFNSGVYIFDYQAAELSNKITNNNKAGEYYLTDLLNLYRDQGSPVCAFKLDDHEEVMGANDRVGLAQMEEIMRVRIADHFMRGGVTVQAPNTVQIEDTVMIGSDVTLEPGVILRGETRISGKVTIGAYSVLSDSVLEEGTYIKPHSVLEGAYVGKDAQVGPFARLRPGTVLSEKVHVGNFVETKNAKLNAGVKAGHLAYLGDVSIGAETNVGAGTIVANFDGINKHKSEIGAGVFIGSNSTIIAPRKIGDAAFIAAGSAVHENIPEGAMAIARGRQRVLEGWSRRYWSGVREKVKVKLPWLAAWLERQG